MAQLILCDACGKSVRVARDQHVRVASLPDGRTFQLHDECWLHVIEIHLSAARRMVEALKEERDGRGSADPAGGD